MFNLLEFASEDLRGLPLLSRRNAVYWFGSPAPWDLGNEGVQAALGEEVVMIADTVG